MRSQKGFSLIELLIVLFILALMGILAVVAVNSARSKARDATRLSQVRQVQSGLEDHFNETNAYPAGVSLPLGDPRLSACLGTGGFSGNCDGQETVFLQIITATIDKGLDGMITCGEPAQNAYCYSQTVDGSAYQIQFELENALPQVGLVKGRNCATPDGMKGGVCL